MLTLEDVEDIEELDGFEEVELVVLCTEEVVLTLVDELEELLTLLVIDEERVVPVLDVADDVVLELLETDEVEVHPPTIDGTALVPDPIATMFVPQLAACAM